MFCFYCDRYMGDIEYIDVIHEHQNKKKKYYNIPRHKCSCGAGRVPKEIYEFMNENMDNNKQLNDKNDKDEPRYNIGDEVGYLADNNILHKINVITRYKDGKGYLYAVGYKTVHYIIREEDIVEEI